MTAPAMETTSEDRMMAGISHLLGFWIALIIWLVEKDKSRYVSFQAMQSLAYSVVVWGLGFVVSLVFGLLVLVVFVLLAGFVVSANSHDPSAFLALPVVLPMMVFGIFLPYGLLIWVPRIIAAVQTFQGREFRYPWLGGFVERLLKSS